MKHKIEVKRMPKNRVYYEIRRMFTPFDEKVEHTALLGWHYSRSKAEKHVEQIKRREDEEGGTSGSYLIMEVNPKSGGRKVVYSNNMVQPEYSNKGCRWRPCGEEWTDGYKVLIRTCDGRLVSPLLTVTEGRKEYRLGEVTTPEPGHGPLSVFRTLETAQFFAGRKRYQKQRAKEIYRCKYKPSQETQVWTNVLLPVSVYHLSAGTDLADAVKIEERVQ